MSGRVRNAIQLRVPTIAARLIISPSELVCDDAEDDDFAMAPLLGVGFDGIDGVLDLDENESCSPGVVRSLMWKVGSNRANVSAMYSN